MNLSQALDQPSADFVIDRGVERFPTFNPKVISREHREPQGTVYMVLVPGSRRVLYLTSDQWNAVQLFDGRRSYEQVVRLLRQRGIGFSVDALRGLCEQLDERGFWFKTPQEESIALLHKLADGRARKKRKASDFYKMDVWVFDPVRMFNFMHRWAHWAFTEWFTLLSFAAFAVMAGMWISRWDQIWQDTFLYYNFTQKSGSDLLEFYLLFAVVAFIHESGHALTATHFGAEVHRMGFMLIYTTPAVFVDSGEVWVYGGRRERCITILAGLWAEVLVCGVLGTFVWWATPTGAWLHDFAYKLMLLGTILPVLINLNPLMRLDGYLCMCEWLRIPGLKQKSAAFVSSWVKKHIFHMPATVPYLTRRRAWFFAIYGILSGIYSYLVLLFLARITYKVVHYFSPDWAFLPATLVALKIFKSRIIGFLDFCKSLYLDKKEIMLAHRYKFAAVAAVVLLLLVLPLRHESVEARFLLEPVSRAELRAQVPGVLSDIRVAEGQHVAQGAVVARLTDLDLETDSAAAHAGLQLAVSRATQAELNYGSYAEASVQQRARAEEDRLVGERRRRLLVVSPIAGTVATPRVRDLAGQYLAAGALIAQIDDLSVMRARVYVSETDLRTLHELQAARLRPDSRFGAVPARLVSLAPASDDLPAGLLSLEKYKGTKPPPFFVAMFLVPNDQGDLRDGETGTAMLYGPRRSLLLQAGRIVADFIGRKIW